MRTPLVVSLLASLLLPSVPACSDDEPPPGDSPDAAPPDDDDDDDQPDASPPDQAEFRRFRRFSAGGPCPEDLDCAGYIDLRHDGRLRVDRVDELPVVVHEAQVSREDLDAAVAVLTDPELVALLDLAGPPCEPPTDIYDSMLLVEEDARHSNSVTFCSDAPITAARAVLDDLVESYLP